MCRSVSTHRGSRTPHPIRMNLFLLCSTWRYCLSVYFIKVGWGRNLIWQVGSWIECVSTWAVEINRGLCRLECNDPDHHWSFSMSAGKDQLCTFLAICWTCTTAPTREGRLITVGLVWHLATMLLSMAVKFVLKYSHIARLWLLIRLEQVRETLNIFFIILFF